jgi:hypothetical protein
MSDLVKVGSQFPVLDPERVAIMASRFSETLGGTGLTPRDLPLVKIPAGGGKYWEVDGHDASEVLRGVVVHIKDTRTLYKEAFSGGNEPPDCASEDGIFGVGDPGGSCLSCPYNCYNSDCKPYTLVFIVLEGDRLPVRVRLPRTSLKHLRKYRLSLLNKDQLPREVITLISIIKAKSQGGIEYSEAKLVAECPLEADEAAALQTYAEAIKPMFAAEATPPAVPEDELGF